MEIKLLLYILAAIIWFFYKTSGEKKKRETKTPPEVIQPEIIRKTSVKPMVPAKPQVKNTAVPSTLIQNKNKTFDKGYANYVNPEMRTLNKSYEANDKLPYNSLTNQSESDQYSDMENPSAGSLIGDSIRNGSMNWKQAVVINELLRPAYL